MNFLNPIALIGLVAAAIPIVLHFLNLRKLKIIEFSSLRFLKELQKTKIRRLKLKQIILLILRTLAVVFVIISLARPAIEGTLPGFGSYSKTSAVIILDNSFSMDLSDESGNRFTQARNAAMSILNELKEGDEATIIEMADGEFNKISTLSRNFENLKGHLSKIKVEYRKANIERSLRTAIAVLKKGVNINKEVFIISDAQNNIFLKDIKDSFRISDPPVVYFVQIGANSENSISNASVDSIEVMNRIFQYDKLVEVEATISNNSKKDLNSLVVSMFFNKSRVAQRSLDIPAERTRKIEISASPQQYGLIKALVQIEDDALNLDNKRHFGFVIPDKPKVALIGDIGTTKFIQLILASGSNGENLTELQNFDSKQIPAVNFTDYDMIIFAGGPYLSSDFQKLAQYIKNGGAGLIFADAITEFELFKTALSEMGFGIIKEKKFEQSNPSVFTMVDKIHPIFEGVFKGTTDNKSMVESPNIYRTYSNNGGLTIISITGGNFLSESRLDNGKAIYCSVTPDAQWSSFPLTGLFPAFIYRSVIYLSSTEGLGRFANTGENVMLSLPKRFASGSNFKIVDANEITRYQSAVMPPSGAVLSLDNLNVPGVTTIYSNQEKIIDMVSVNHPSSESKLQSAVNSTIKKSLEELLGVRANINIITEPKKVMDKVNRLRTGTELWQIFIILALMCLVAEMIVRKNNKNDTEN
ncbi:MAG: BatA domain-containing protein [bacterium]